MADNQGLYVKYIVTKIEDGSLVYDCFVLRPSKDEHARAALVAYADSVAEVNPALCGDLLSWVDAIERNPAPAPPAEREVDQKDG